jgi:hypothetical protein
MAAGPVREPGWTRPCLRKRFKSSLSPSSRHTRSHGLGIISSKRDTEQVINTSEKWARRSLYFSRILSISEHLSFFVVGARYRREDYRRDLWITDLYLVGKTIVVALLTFLPERLLAAHGPCVMPMRWWADQKQRKLGPYFNNNSKSNPSRKTNRPPRGASGCRRDLCWNWVTRLRHFESTESGREVNCLTDGCFGKRPPTVNLSHADLTGSEQRPKQHRGCLS